MLWFSLLQVIDVRNYRGQVLLAQEMVGISPRLDQELPKASAFIAESKRLGSL